MPRVHSKKETEGQETNTHLVLDQRRGVGRCVLCQKDVTNPCAPDPKAAVEDLVETKPLPVPLTDVVRAKPKNEVMTQLFFCQTMKELVRLKLKTQEVRAFVSHNIFEGLYHGIRYEYPWGAKMEIGPDWVEDIFDGRPQLALRVETPTWEDEVIASDRSIGDALTKAAAGELTEPPEPHFFWKLVAIRMAMDTPPLDPSDLD